MQLLTIGLNHTTAPVALRESVSFAGEALPVALANLRSRLDSHTSEAAILSTCNRTEIYCVTEEPESTRSHLADWLDEQKTARTLSRRTELDGLDKHLYALPHHESIRHAFRVAAGLDSMVLGEPQILGQMKDAARAAQQAGSLGTYLHNLFQRSFEVAKEVRSSTDIGAHSVSLAANSVKIAKRIYEDLSQLRVLLIGAGEMIELVGSHFAAQQPKQLVVANRTVERASALARKLNGQAIALTELPGCFAQFDVVISCTASSLPIIGLGQVERSQRARRRKPVLMIDLAVPRDIEADVADLDGVFLYTVDDLGKQADAGMQSRRAAVESAEMIVNARVRAFLNWLSARAAVPQIQSLHARAELLKKNELERALKQLALGRDPATIMAALANSMTAKYLHGPMTLLSRWHEDPQRIAQLIDQVIPDSTLGK